MGLRASIRLDYNRPMAKFIILLVNFCSLAFGARKIETPITIEDTGSINFLNILIENPSSVTQTVDVRLKSRGMMRLKAASSTTDDTKSDGAIECVLAGTVYTCDLVSSQRAIAPGSSLQLRLGTELTGSNTNRELNTGVIATVTVAENTGYLVGSFVYTVGGAQSYVHVPMAAGRAF